MSIEITREGRLYIAQDDGTTQVSIKLINNEVESIVISDLADDASRQEFRVFSNGDLAFLRSLGYVIRDVLSVAKVSGAI